MKKMAVILVLLLTRISYVQAQGYILNLTEVNNQKELNTFKLKKNYPTKEKVKAEIKTIIASLQSSGYLLANLDSLIETEKIITAYISVGNKYKWAKLIIDPKDKMLINECGLNEKIYNNAIFKPATFSSIYNKLLTYLENNGYPFASIKFDSLHIENSCISTKLLIKKNQFIKLDSLIQYPNDVVTYNFLSHYLQVKEGMPYNEKKFSEIEKKIKQLPFLSQNKETKLQITDKQSKLYLFLIKKNASQFDGIIGLLPDNKGKTVFTGDVKIKLSNNVFKSGEVLEANFRRLQTQTQDILIKFSYPYLFKTPIGTDYGIKIYRKDTSFIDVQNNVGIQYFFSGLNHIKLYYKQRNSNLISTSGYETSTVLPEFADIITSAYGAGVSYENFDYKFNPRKGFSISLNSSAGTRNIRKNPRLNEIVYQNTDLSSTQFQGEGVITGYLPLSKKSCLKLGLQAAGLYSKQIFRNELFRIGGLKTIRGFDEESIYASAFVIPTVELRYLFEQNSALFIFGESAWYENNNIKNYISDKPYSFGAGINFETKAGIFSLNYALGSQLGNAIDIKTGKVHFGIVSVF